MLSDKRQIRNGRYHQQIYELESTAFTGSTINVSSRICTCTNCNSIKRCRLVQNVAGTCVAYVPKEQLLYANVLLTHPHRHNYGARVVNFKLKCFTQWNMYHMTIKQTNRSITLKILKYNRFQLYKD